VKLPSGALSSCCPVGRRSAAVGSAAPASQLGLQCRQLVVHLRGGRHLVELLLNVVDWVRTDRQSAPDANIRRWRPRRAAYRRSCPGPLHVAPALAWSRRSRHGLAHLGLGLGRGVRRFIVLLRAEALDPIWSSWGLTASVPAPDLSCWVFSSASCSPSAARRDSASRARSSLPCVRALGLTLQLVGLLLQPWACSSIACGCGHIATPDAPSGAARAASRREVQVSRGSSFVQGLVGLDGRCRDPTEKAAMDTEHKASGEGGHRAAGPGPPLRSRRADHLCLLSVHAHPTTRPPRAPMCQVPRRGRADRAGVLTERGGEILNPP